MKTIIGKFLGIRSMGLMVAFSLVPIIAGISEHISAAEDADDTHDCLAFVKIYSDPPGARIYGSDGSDWGQTSENGAVGLWFGHGWNEDPYGRWGDCPTDVRATLTAKKRGYKATEHTFPLKYRDWRRYCFQQNFHCSWDEFKQEVKSKYSSSLTIVLDSDEP